MSSPVKSSHVTPSQVKVKPSQAKVKVKVKIKPSRVKSTQVESSRVESRQSQVASKSSRGKVKSSRVKSSQVMSCSCQVKSSQVKLLSYQVKPSRAKRCVGWIDPTAKGMPTAVRRQRRDVMPGQWCGAVTPARWSAGKASSERRLAAPVFADCSSVLLEDGHQK